MLTQSLLVCISLLEPEQAYKEEQAPELQHTRFFFLFCQTENRVKAKMRLFLAVAVLMLAFIAYTEAQDDGIEQKFTQFGERVTQLGQDLAEKAKTTFEGIHNSEAMTKTRDWFTEQIEALKTKVRDISQ